MGKLIFSHNFQAHSGYVLFLATHLSFHLTIAPCSSSLSSCGSGHLMPLLPTTITILTLTFLLSPTWNHDPDLTSRFSPLVNSNWFRDRHRIQSFSKTEPWDFHWNYLESDFLFLLKITKLRRHELRVAILPFYRVSDWIHETTHESVVKRELLMLLILPTSSDSVMPENRLSLAFQWHMPTSPLNLLNHLTAFICFYLNQYELEFTPL